MESKYDFVHFFMVNSPIYNKATYEMLTCENSSYSHLFVYANQDYIIKSETGDNVLLDREIYNVSKIKEYLNLGKYVVLHALEYSFRDLAKLDVYFAQRVIWCVWGHDIYHLTGTSSLKSLFYDVIRCIYRKFIYRKLFQKYKITVSHFKGVFVGLNYDKKRICNLFGQDMNVYIAQYLLGQQLALKNEDIDSVNKNKVKVLLGHSSAPFYVI